MENPNVLEEPKTNPNYKDGVFYFSNSAKDDFVFRWNNIDYFFPSQTCSPMLIPGVTPEEMQEIRKRAAFKWAQQQWFKSKEYVKMVKNGGRVPAIPNDNVLDPFIQMCLNPLPIKQATSKEAPKEKRSYSGRSKPVKKTGSLNDEFKDDVPEELGEL